MPTKHNTWEGALNDGLCSKMPTLTEEANKFNKAELEMWINKHTLQTV